MGFNNTQLTGRVIYQGDPGYDEAVLNWNPYVNTLPLVFVFAQNACDVSNAIKWARENDVPLRIRSGRHALDKDLSVVKGGIVIDTGDMNQFHLDKRKHIATVQPGIRVGPLVKALAREGFMAVFGDSPSVGIGGITTGGGFGVLSRSIGLISDNLLALETVDAQGNILKANPACNKDLFWASRGGGGGTFGYNTEYTFKVHRAPETATVFDIVWPWEQLETAFRAWQNLMPFVDERLGSYMEILSKVNGLCHVSGLFLGSRPELTQILQPLLNAGTPTNVVIETLFYPDCIDFLDPPDPIADQNFKFSSAWSKNLWQDEPISIMKQFLEEAPGTESNFYFTNWGGAISRVPKDKTAFYWRSPLFYTEWNATWIDPSEEASSLASVESVRQQLKPYVVGSYVNVPDENIENFGSAYWGTNFARLQRVKAKYDPENIFNHPQSVPPSC
ncbi:FAD-binding oxidoreductase [Fictibacillus phosphorivorans]|uniref:FAD-binding oxidoreductase n=1 Tax=Fictibacillus phosphorivorans TaxID=1221500 RepID=UPI00203C8F71|nr:FAD-binding oxidoreductase [Fictibacillus phosphorivorans]MCM3718048.1 FAD-binding oxidoreductase [Fictibacillus phosphorivorans]MCM3775675.1 FAD-binding oxidoreductase [Fictibacillus phosphorivorans]